MEATTKQKAKKQKINTKDKQHSETPKHDKRTPMQ